MRICIGGKNEIAVQGLKSALELVGRANVYVCPNLTDDGVSRWQPSLRKFAREWRVKELSLKEIADIKDCIFISLEFDQLLNPAEFKTSRLFNVHFSNLPKYRGMFTSVWPILNGDINSGVTLHKIDHGIDTGDIVDQLNVDIKQEFTSRDLYFAYMEAACGNISRWLKVLLAGAESSQPQPALGASYYSRRSIDFRNFKLDVKNVASHVERQVKAFSFREYQLPCIEKVAISGCKILDRRSYSTPGSVLDNRLESIIIATIDYDCVLFKDRFDEYMEIVERGDIEHLSSVECKKYLNMTNSNGHSPIMIAAYNGYFAICRHLRDRGADIHKTNQNGTNPLMYATDYAARTGDFSICKLLLDSGCDPTKPDRFGRDVIDYARLKGQWTVLNFFGRG